MTLDVQTLVSRCCQSIKIHFLRGMNAHIISLVIRNTKVTYMTPGLCIHIGTTPPTKTVFTGEPGQKPKAGSSPRSPDSASEHTLDTPKPARHYVRNARQDTIETNKHTYMYVHMYVWHIDILR